MSLINRRKIQVKGIVQGVGFRPFIYKIALENKLFGWVFNDSDGVTIEVEGNQEQLDKFISEISSKKPPLAVVNEVIILSEDENIANKYSKFEITESHSKENRQTLIAPDNNVCEDCLNELFNKDDRRFGYPFINCTNCGPRYSIIENIPYDRKYTTMKDFKMCEQCNSEYTDPLNRRFHAQPNACWKCGPMLNLQDNSGKEIKVENIITESVKLLKEGKILAIKGIGGFHLVADPLNNEAVKNLRIRKKRKYKPFALMSGSIEDIKTYSDLSVEDEEILSSKERPIVLVKKNINNDLPDDISPRNRYFGVMLAYTPLHYLLLKDNFKSLIFTSGNVSDEPIVFKNEDAIKYLGTIADYILTNNRDIYIRNDDSIVSNINKGDEVITQISRRARGFVPKPISTNKKYPSGLALGAELKNTVTLNRGSDFFISQHIGDLKNQKIYDSHKLIIEHLKSILEVEPEFIVSDMHPGFLNTRYAIEQKELPVIQVQHHHAHMASCMFENGLDEKVIGVIYDGVGYGLDGNSWGGEFLVGGYERFERAGHFNYFKLLGGDKAVKEPYRIALSLLFDIYGAEFRNLDFPILKNKDSESIEILYKMYQNDINTHLTSSIGRIFDAVSALIGVREFIEYEGQAAIELEQEINPNKLVSDTFSTKFIEDKEDLIVDTQFLFKEMCQYLLKGNDRHLLSSLFHNTVANISVDVCNKIREKTGVNKVVLSGGVFQNKYLIERSINNLTRNSFEVFVHKDVPTNDGGISLGQLIIGHNQR